MKKSFKNIFYTTLLVALIIPQISVANILVGEGKACNFVKDGLYQPFSNITQSFPGFGTLMSGGCINVATQVDNMFNVGFQVFLGVVTLIAVVQVSVAGIQWMIQDTGANTIGKTTAKQKLTNSIIGLILALSSWIILNTVNPRIVLVDLQSTIKGGALAGYIKNGIQQAENANIQPTTPNTNGGTNTGGNTTNGGTTGGGTFVQGSGDFAGESNTQLLLNQAAGGSRTRDGGLNISLYSSTDDNTTDSNTAAGRGNKDNLLRAGSVALSPDLITKLKPKTGQSIYINNVHVGYYEDSTSAEWVNTVDLYNPNGAYGNTNDTLKVLPANSYNITLGNEIRPQIPNPSK